MGAAVIEDLETSKDKILATLMDENEKLRNVVWSYYALFTAHKNIDSMIDPADYPKLMQQAQDALHPDTPAPRAT